MSGDWRVEVTDERSFAIIQEMDGIIADLERRLRDYGVELAQERGRAERAEAEVGRLTRALEAIVARHPDAEEGEHPAVDMARAVLGEGNDESPQIRELHPGEGNA